MTEGSVSIGKATVAKLVQRDVCDITVMGRRPKLLDAQATEIPGVNFLPFGYPNFKDWSHFEVLGGNETSGPNGPLVLVRDIKFLGF